MRTIRLRTLLLAAAFAIPLAADAPPIQKALSSQQFKQLRQTARTPEEFQLLASYAFRQAEVSRHKADECQQELDGYLSGAVPTPTLPKFPTRVDTLKSLVTRYRDSEHHWKSLALSFERKARP